MRESLPITARLMLLAEKTAPQAAEQARQQMQELKSQINYNSKIDVGSLYCEGVHVLLRARSNELTVMTYYVIYDGNCNLCVSLVQLLETLDKGQMFRYAPMQDEETLKRWGITPSDCELGMILIDADSQERRWQGSAAAEEIGRLLPPGDVFVSAYRSLPGLKWVGDRAYEQLRDNRYSLFGKRSSTYKTAYAADCGCTKTNPD